MIYVYGQTNGVGLIHRYLAVAGLPSQDVRIYPDIDARPYRELLSRDAYRFFDGVHVFTDLQLLSGLEIEKLAQIVRRVRESALRSHVLNDPLGCMGRYEQLRSLFESGINRHNVYAVSERRRPSSWPVFVRGETGHRRTRLLRDEEDLEHCLSRLQESGRWFGDKLIVEFNDAQGADGLYRKYGAFRIGGKIVADHLYIGPNWCIRTLADVPEMQSDPKLLAESFAYVRTNPHAAEVMDIFEHCGMQYGRMDYGIVDGRIQVWEINSAPVLLLPQDFAPGKARMRPRFEIVADNLYSAFAELDAKT